MQQLYTFDDIKDAVSGAVREIFPVTANNYAVTLDSVDIPDRLDEDDIGDQYKKVLSKGNWTVPVYANVTLRGPDGVVDKGRVRMLSLPKMTSRKTFIVGGTEKQLHNVLRRRSGVYTYTDQAGKLVSEYNLDNGLHSGGRIDRGREFKLRFDEDSKKFLVQIGGKKTINAYNLLNILGVDTEGLESRFGGNLHAANTKITKAKERRDVIDAYMAIYDQTADPDLPVEEMKQRVREAFNRTTLDGVTTNKTLGTSHERISGDTILSTMDKLLAVSRGAKEEDDREDLEFKKVISPAALFSEAVSHKLNLRNAQDKIKFRLARRTMGKYKDWKLDSVEKAVPANLLERPVHELVRKSTEADSTSYANPSGLMSGYNNITMLGTGAISNLRAVPTDAPLLSQSHLGFVDPLHSPESKNIGISLHLAKDTKYEGGVLKAKMWDRNGGEQYVSSEDASREVVAFPDEYDFSSGKPVPLRKVVRARVPGKDVLEDVPPESVSYILNDNQSMFDISTNLSPFLQSNQGNRAAMSGKHSTQTLPLKYREPPLIATGIEDELTEIAGVRKSPVSGVVESVQKSEGEYKIRIMPEGKQKAVTVHAYRNYPMPMGLIYDSEVKVKPGDEVRAGDILADSLFSKDGKLALGKNLHTAYMPWKGKAFEDGLVISDRAAKELTSVHLHEASKDLGDATMNRGLFLDWFRTRFRDASEIAALDPNGIIKKGQKVAPGQLLAVGLLPVDPSTEEGTLRKRRKLAPYNPTTLVWDHDSPGTVEDVRRLADGSVRVLVKTEEPMQLGDKLVGRVGNKGIVTEIVPSEEMPKTKDGQPIDVILSPLGVPGRINLGQVLETAAAKVADKQGRQLVIKPFSNENYLERVQKLLKDNNISSEEELLDPTRSDRSFGKVFAGQQYFYKLNHQVGKKGSTRSRGAYDRWGVPAGGTEGAQALGELGSNALLTHGAIETLRDMQLHKSQRNEDLWEALLQGKPAPMPKHITPNERFEGLLRVAGVKLEKGDPTVLVPQTDEQTKILAGGRDPLEKPAAMFAFFRDKVREESEGLFDHRKTGGPDGTKWSYFRLPEPVPNPIYEDPIRVLTDLSAGEYDDIVSGRTKVDGLTGGPAIKAMLEKVDLKKEQSRIKSDMKKTRESKLAGETKINTLTRLYKQHRYINNLMERGLRPEDVYLVQSVPVIPPRLRPVVSLGTMERSGDDLNNLYRDLALVSDTMAEHKAAKLDDTEHIQPLREALYDGLSALVQAKGSTRPLSGSYQGVIGAFSGKRPNVAGAAGEVGEGPKKGFFQTHILRRRQDFSARTTITVDPRLRLDEVGIPYEMAHGLYEPWVRQKLRSTFGLSLEGARKLYEEGSDNPRVRQVLNDVVRERPVLMKRDPALHKFNVMGAKPVLVEGKSIQIHPLVTSGFNADFDGDTMSVFVPVSQKAVEEAQDLMPSKNMFSPSSHKLVNVPGHEMLWGLSEITRVGKDTKKSFSSHADARTALSRGEIGETDQINIGARKTTMGWELVNQALPERYRYHEEIGKRKPIVKKELSALLHKIGEKDIEELPTVVDDLKDIGNEYATRAGLSFTLADFKVVDPKYRDRVFDTAEEKVKRGAPPIQALGMAMEDVNNHNLELLNSGKEKRGLYEIFTSGSRGTWGQMKQILSSPGLVMDAKARVVPRLIRNSFSEGLNLADYWTHLHGARKGAVDKSVSTSRPGYLSKQISRTTMDAVVAEPDCGTGEGVDFSTSDEEAVGRYLSKTINLSGPRGRTFQRGMLVTPDVLTALKAHKVPSLQVRSPLQCECEGGVCSKCMGLDEEGKPTQVGKNVGLMAAQAVGERSTQVSLNVFHEGGVVSDWRGRASADSIGTAEHLLRMTRTIPGSAILSPASGKVREVKEAPQGGVDIVVGRNKGAHVPADRTLRKKIEVGAEVKAGEPLTLGVIHPGDLLQYRGSLSAQRSLVDQLGALYSGTGVKKKHMELIVKQMSNTTRIVDPAGSKWVSGQSAPLASVKRYNKSVPKAGRIRHAPTFWGVNTAPSATEDWLARMGGDNLRETIVSAITQGWRSRPHGPHPTPSLTFLTEEQLRPDTGFGRPEPGGPGPY